MVKSQSCKSGQFVWSENTQFFLFLKIIFNLSISWNAQYGKVYFHKKNRKKKDNFNGYDPLTYEQRMFFYDPGGLSIEEIKQVHSEKAVSKLCSKAKSVAF